MDFSGLTLSVLLLQTHAHTHHPFLEEFNADWLRQDLILKITFDIRKARTLTSPQGTNSRLFFTSIKTLISRSNKPNPHIYFGAHREGEERAFQVISSPADSVPPYGFLFSLPLPYASTTPRSSSSSFESTARSGWKVRYHCALVDVGLRNFIRSRILSYYFKLPFLDSFFL